MLLCPFMLPGYPLGVTIKPGEPGIDGELCEEDLLLTELAKDVDVRTVQDIVGHSDVATTLRFYAHVLRSMRQRAGAVFDEAKPAARPERSCGGERYPNHGFRLPGVVGGSFRSFSLALNIGCTFRGKTTLGA